MLPTPQDAENRQPTAFRKRLGERRTRTLNKIQLILMQHNLQQDSFREVAPTLRLAQPPLLAVFFSFGPVTGERILLNRSGWPFNRSSRANLAPPR
jgi:hypothetical protein